MAVAVAVAAVAVAAASAWATPPNIRYTPILLLLLCHLFFTPEPRKLIIENFGFEPPGAPEPPFSL